MAGGPLRLHGRAAWIGGLEVYGLSIRSAVMALVPGLAILLAGCIPGQSSRPQASRAAPSQPISSIPLSVTARPAAAAVPRDQPPADLLNAVQRLGGEFQGRVGIAIRDVEDGWSVGYNADIPLPQQSVSKFWVAVAVMDAVDRGTLSLSDPITVQRSDLTLFHQPIRALVGADGYRTTIDTLLRGAMTQSDNTCNDVLLWKVGGPAAINRMLADKKIPGVRFGPGERVLQARTAGLEWRPEWAGGWGFLQARAALSFEARDKALTRYLASPYDGASANGVTLGLAALQRGTLLSNASTVHLLTLMRASKTGPLRMKSGLQPGWTMAHKTGTGQELGSLATGYNDVGLIRSPDGHNYAVAVMIGSTRLPISVRMRLMGDVTRALIRTVGTR